MSNQFIIYSSGRPSQVVETSSYISRRLQEPLAWVDTAKLGGAAAGPSIITADTPVAPSLLREAAGCLVYLLADPGDSAAKEDLAALGRALCAQVRTNGVHTGDLPVNSDPNGLGLDDCINLASKVGPGNRFDVPDGKGGHWIVPYWDRSEPKEPRLFHETPDKDGPVKRSVVDAPFAWPHRRIVEVDLPDGVTLDGEVSGRRVLDELRGVACGDPVAFCMPGADFIEVGRWRDLGFSVCKPADLQLLARIHGAILSIGLVPTAYTTARRGWVGLWQGEERSYIYGNRVISPRGGKAMIVKPGADPLGVDEKGTAVAWASVAGVALHNPALAVLSGLAVSSLLLALLADTEPCIASLVGASGYGKTTLLQAVAALIGDPRKPAKSTTGTYIRALRTTDNALESILADRSDCAVLLDEIHLLPTSFDYLGGLYMVAGGQGKHRSGKGGEARPTKRWIVQVLASGEEGFLSKLVSCKNGRSQAPGGLQFRVVDIYAEEAGLWSDVDHQAMLPDGGRYSSLLAEYAPGRSTSSQAIVEALEAALVAHHGHAWPLLVRSLQDPARREAAQQRYGEFRRTVEAEFPDRMGHKILSRRVKHVAAALTGLELLLAVVGDCQAEEIRARAYKWATECFWTAGLDGDAEQEGTEIAGLVEKHILDHADRLYKSSKAASFQGVIGWPVGVHGEVFIPTENLTSIAGTLNIDATRARAALMTRGWTKSQLRHPEAGKGSHRLRGLKSPENFISSDDDLPRMSSGEVF